MHIRKATLEDAEGIAKVHVSSWQKTYKDIAPQDFLDRLSVEERTALWQKNISNPNNEVFVAVTPEQQIIGFVDGLTRDSNKDIGSSDLTSIYLLKEYQGLGIGKQLLKAIMESFQSRGFKRVYVDVLADNPARNFYIYYGADHVKTLKLNFAGNIVDEEVYVWNDIDAVLKKLQ